MYIPVSALEYEENISVPGNQDFPFQCVYPQSLNKNLFEKRMLWPLFMDGVQLPEG